MYFGTFMKKQRIIKGYSQQDLATYLGIKRQAISRWENNLAYPAVNHLYPLSKFLELSAEELLKNLPQSSNQKEE
ncbi:helix-turn-helix domain-containing protein [Enterococcus bulliens]